MKIIIDGMGGDLAPLEALKGAAAAVLESDISVIVVGDEAVISKTAKENNISLKNIEVVHAPSVIPMDAQPGKILKEYKDSSMAIGLDLLSKGEGSAFVSAGSTGALLFGSTFIIKRLKGVKRPAIGTMVPTGKGKYYLLLDAGANNDCRPEMLNQFAIMGTAYWQGVYNKENPSVGLVNIGSEAHKGDDLRKDAYSLLKEEKYINFIGNVEARELPLAGCDIAVCDGFTGNIILKLSEGFGKFFGNSLKDMLFSNALTKVCALILKGKIRELKKMMDYKEQGGAPLLGIRKPVIKAHGASDEKAFKNAIKQAVFCVKGDVCLKIQQIISEEQTENTKSETEE